MNVVCGEADLKGRFMFSMSFDLLLYSTNFYYVFSRSNYSLVLLKFLLDAIVRN